MKTLANVHRSTSNGSALLAAGVQRLTSNEVKKAAFIGRFLRERKRGENRGTAYKIAEVQIGGGERCATMAECEKACADVGSLIYRRSSPRLSNADKFLLLFARQRKRGHSIIESHNQACIKFQKDLVGIGTCARTEHDGLKKLEEERAASLTKELVY